MIHYPLYPKYLRIFTAFISPSTKKTVYEDKDKENRDRRGTRETGEQELGNRRWKKNHRRCHAEDRAFATNREKPTTSQQSIKFHSLSSRFFHHCCTQPTQYEHFRATSCLYIRRLYTYIMHINKQIN